MIGRALVDLPTYALQRIESAPMRRWTSDDYADDLGRCCLVGHAADARLNELTGVLTTASVHGIEMVSVCLADSAKSNIRSVEKRFDALCYRHGVERIVPLIQARARQALARKAVASWS